MDLVKVRHSHIFTTNKDHFPQADKQQLTALQYKRPSSQQEALVLSIEGTTASIWHIQQHAQNALNNKQIRKKNHLKKQKL